MAKTNATPSAPPSIKSLIDRREADVRSGRLAGHTPGPWERRDYANKEGDIWIDCAAWKGRSLLGGTLAIALAKGAGDGQLDANASLIAAAPELLRALKELRDNVERDMSGYWTESTSNLMQQADAVIASAEGRC